MDLSEFIANCPNNKEQEWVEIMSLTFDRRDIGGSLFFSELIPISKIKTKRVSINTDRSIILFEMFRCYLPIFVTAWYVLHLNVGDALRLARDKYDLEYFYADTSTTCQ